MAVSPRQLLLAGVAATAVLAWVMWRRGPATPVAPLTDNLPVRPPPAAALPAAVPSIGPLPARALDDTRPSIDPAAPPPQPAFDGRTARLLGRITRDGRGVAAQVEIVAGMDRGVVVATDADGCFGRDGLFPAVAWVAVRVAGRVEAERRLLLRAQVPARLDLDVGARHVLRGTVHDERGAPLAGVEVTCDGRRGFSAGDGKFVVPDVSDGRAWARFRGDGRARRDVEAWGEVACTVRLAPAGVLAVTLPPRRLASDVHVYLVAAAELPERREWAHGGVIRARDGDVLVIDDLPAGQVAVHAFAGDAHGVAVQQVTAGNRREVVVEWRPLPVLRGLVRVGENPVARATIVLRVADELAAVRWALEDAAHQLRSLPFEPLPSLRQQTASDREGRFTLARPLLPARPMTMWLEVRAAGMVHRRELADPDAPVTIDLRH